MRKILIIFVLFIGCNQQATGDKSPQIGDILRAFVGSGANCIHSHRQTGRGRLDNMMHNAAEQTHWNQMEYLHQQQNWQNSDLKRTLDQGIWDNEYNYGIGIDDMRKLGIYIPPRP